MPANILEFFSRHGLRTTRKTNDEWCGPCPACGGKDRCSIWPDDQEGRGYYWCRQCEGQGDGIQFLRDFCGMSYADACKAVGVAPAQYETTPRLAPGPGRHGDRGRGAARLEARPREDLTAVQPEAAQGHGGVDRALWRQKATAFAAWAHEKIWQEADALAWLAARGLPEEAVRRYGLGWNPGEKGQGGIVRPRERWGLPPQAKDDGKPKKLWLPKGLVIPQLLPGADGVNEANRLRVRRPDAERARFNPEQKYFVVPGSEMDPLFLPRLDKSGPDLVVVVESELDAFLLHHAAGDFMSVLSIGTCKIKALPQDIFVALERAACILVAFDFDAPDEKGRRAGANGWPRWKETFDHSRRWPVPMGKDPGEAFAMGLDLPLWLKAGLPEGLRFIMQAGLCAGGLEGKEAAKGEEAAAARPAIPEEVHPEAPDAPEAGPVATLTAPAPSPAPCPAPAADIPAGPTSPSRLASPASALHSPLGPLDSLKILKKAGLRAVVEGDDYRVYGHERWTLEDKSTLFAWFRAWGEFVRLALFDAEYKNQG